MKIIAVRHGQTEGNVAHIIQSRTGGVLTELGIRQAAATADTLRDERFNIAYCSDMQRCIDTAGAVMKFHQDTPLVLREELRELSKGIYEGRQWEDLPGFAAREDSPHEKVEGGESWLDVDFRLRGFLDILYEQHKDESVLLVTHNGVMKVLASILGQKPLMTSIKEEFDNGSYGRWNMDAPVSVGLVR